MSDNTFSQVLTGVMLFMVSLTTFAQEKIDIATVRQTGLWMVEIKTLNNEEPQGQPITHPVNPEVHNYIYTNKVPCRIIITAVNDTLYDSGEYEKNVSGATIRINGNTTAYYSDELNMPYKLKLQKAADLLCRDDDRFKDKDWRLLKDAMSLNTIVALKLSQIIGMEWTAQCVPCNVVINGDYRGCYLLIETVKRNNDCRIACDKQQGYIVERDPYWWKEEVYFCTHWYEKANTYRWTWKYPEDEDVTDEKTSYIRDYINAAEQSIINGNYEAFIDPLSFAKWLLTHDILGTWDSGGSNMFFKKYDETSNSRLEMPCVWDFDSSYEMGTGNFSRLHTSSNAYFSTLLNSDNRTFANTYVWLWNEYKDVVKEEIIGFINQFALSDEAKALNTSRKLHSQRWKWNDMDVNADIQKVTEWFLTHLDIIDEKINLIPTDDLSSIDNRQHQAVAETSACSDLKGIRRYSSPRGISIINGKKIFRLPSWH